MSLEKADGSKIQKKLQHSDLFGAPDVLEALASLEELFPVGFEDS